MGTLFLKHKQSALCGPFFSGTLRLRGKSLGNFRGVGKPGAGPRLAFDSLGMDPATGEMLGVKQGVGGLTEGRATSIWLPDYEGVYREFLANEPGWSGGRVVRNQIKQSNNFTDAAWVKLEQGTGTIDPLEAGYEVCPMGLSSTRFKAHLNGGTTDVDRARIIGYLVNSPGVAGKSYGGSIWVKSNTGANQNVLFTSSSAIIQQVVQEVTPTWQRLSFPTFGADVATGYIMVALYGDQTDQDCDILISSAQLEFIDDGESTFVPGEYSDNPNTDTTTARVFGTTNGNTVTDNIVTEARGTDLPEMPYVVHAPQSTNEFLNNTAPATQTISGLTGDYVCWLSGAGSVALTGGMAGTVTAGNPVTSNPGGSDVICTVTGTPDFVMVETGTVPSGFIPTAGAAVTRDACNLTYDRANIPDAEGSLYVEVDGMLASSSSSILSLFLGTISNNVRLNDGGSFTDLTFTDGYLRIGAVWGDGTMRLNVNGSWSTEQTYDGTMPDATLDLFRDAVSTKKMRGLKVWDGKDESVVDGAMA